MNAYLMNYMNVLPNFDRIIFSDDLKTEVKLQTLNLNQATVSL